MNFDKDDIREVCRELKYRTDDPFWISLQICLNEAIADEQAKVNNLDVNGFELERARGNLDLLKKIASGDVIDNYINVLETKIRMQEARVQAEERKRRV